MKKILFAAAFLAALSVCGLGDRAHAAPNPGNIAVSTVSVGGVQLIAVPPTNAVTVIKSLRLCNDTSVDTCVKFNDGTTLIYQLCATKQSCSDAPHDTSNSPYAINSDFAEVLGQNLMSAGVFNVTGSTPSASIAVFATYSQPIR